MLNELKVSNFAKWLNYNSISTVIHSRRNTWLFYSLYYNRKLIIIIKNFVTSASVIMKLLIERVKSSMANNML
jgi:hypothetical protein